MKHTHYTVKRGLLISSGIIAVTIVFGSAISAQYSLTLAQERFDKFNQVENGWCASDATISLPLPGGKTLWLFGDSFIGEKTGTFSINPSRSRMINNSAVLEDESSLTAYYQGTLANPSSFIPAEGNTFFWPEHAVIENDTLKIFAVRITYSNNNNPGFNFKVGTTSIAYYKYPELNYINTKKIPSLSDTTMRFGACAIRSGEFTYIFGLKDTTSGGMTWPLLYLARVKQSVDEPWEFYAGSDSWSGDCRNARPLGDRPMSESFYIYEKDGKFYLIMHEIWLVGKLYILEADKITGPWNRASSGGKENLFAVIKPYPNLFTYNLFAHPQFNNDGKILISFNVNTSDFFSIYSDTRNYRARFYWLDVENAAFTSIPDTLSLHDVYPNLSDNVKAKEQGKISFSPHTRSLQITNVPSPSVLSIYSSDGRKLIQVQISGDTFIPVPTISSRFLIVRLEGKWGSETKKIVSY